jgi:hypothetical protein
MGDSALMNTDWESKFSMVFVHALEQIEGPDHAPILLTTRTPRPRYKRQFKFQLG